MTRAPSIDKNGRKKGAWSEEEDNKLRAYVTRYGHWNWRQLPKFAGLSRCGKSCRLRWVNYLRPNLKLGSYTKEEDDLIIKLHDELGNKWSAIAAKLPGRSDNEIKNHWHSHLRKCAKKNIIIPEKQSRNESESEAEAEADQKEQSSPFTALNEPQQYTETSHMIKVDQERKWTPKDDYSTGPSSSTKSSSSLSSNCAVFDTSNSNTGSSSSLSSIFDWVVEERVVSPGSFDETIDSFWREPFWRDTADEYMGPPLVNHFLSPPSPEEILWSYDHDGFYFEYVNLQLYETAS